MDGLDDFEKQLAAERAEREQEKDRKHHKHRHHHHREREDDGDEGHRHKRSRRSPDGNQDERREHRKREHRDHHEQREHREHREHRHGRSHRHRSDAGELENETHLKTSDPKGDLPLPDEEVPTATKKLVRDDWMSAPSALGVDYTQKGAKREKTPPPKQEPKRAVHAREVNAAELNQLNEGKSWSEVERPAQHDVEHTFGDAGSQWRMTKLKAVYTLAEQNGRPVDEVAIERFGGLREFDDAREERTELDRRNTYGKGYVGKEKPSGELFQERKLEAGIHREAQQPADPQETADSIAHAVAMANESDDEPAPTTRIDQTMLNKMRAQMMKAKLRKAPDAAKLEAEYNQAAAAYVKQGPAPVVLNAMDNRLLAGTRAEAKAIDTKRGRERGLVEENTEMTIDDMVREERRTRGQTGGEGLRLAERIAKDGKFDNNLDYIDENAEKLAKRVQKSEINLKNSAIGDFQKINKILDRCQLCHHEDRDLPPVAPIVSLATRVYLTLPTEPELAEGGAVIVPVQHRTNLLECDEDEWEEIRNFMKCLTRMYHEQGREVVFYENAATPHKHPHAAMQVVPIPYEQGDTAPAFFKEAMLTADEEWSQHKKIIDTGKAARDGLGKLAFRRSIAKEAPYFHVWFSLDGGLGHVVEDANRWPRGDLFAREIIGGMLDVMPDVIKKQGRWHKGDPRANVFHKRWRKFDWTRVLADEAAA